FGLIHLNRKTVTRLLLTRHLSTLLVTRAYYAFGFIREHTKNAKQLFILTHNFSFFQQVRHWFRYRSRQACFYMIDCLYDGEKRFSKITDLDPLLKDYDSEYHYLFSRIYREAGNSTQTSLEEKYIFPNMARRLLESFLSFRQPNIPRGLTKKIELAEFDESKKVRIIRFLQTHSHGRDIGELEHDPSILCETSTILNDLLEFIEALDPKHFSAMVELCNSNDS
ncbi:MAG: AAA family ATPase, partial [Deltaproteobacteria bacterium]|nr:AAA family ATPase [Candidatus Zymogenaceae bacterium]